jgi:hypothetical protein
MIDIEINEVTESTYSSGCEIGKAMKSIMENYLDKYPTNRYFHRGKIEGFYMEGHTEGSSDDIVITDYNNNIILIKEYNKEEYNVLRGIAIDDKYAYWYAHNKETDTEYIFKTEINNVNNVENITTQKLLDAFDKMFQSLGYCGVIKDNKLFYINCCTGHWISYIDLETLEKVNTNIHSHILGIDENNKMFREQFTEDDTLNEIVFNVKNHI